MKEIFVQKQDISWDIIYLWNTSIHHNSPNHFQIGDGWKSDETSGQYESAIVSTSHIIVNSRMWRNINMFPTYNKTASDDFENN